MNILSQANVEVKNFMTELFFNLPMEKNKIQLVKEINKNESISNFGVGSEGVTCEVKRNIFLELRNTESALMIMFNEKNLVTKSIFMISGNKNDKSYFNVVSLLNSLKVDSISDKNKDTEKQESTIFYLNSNDRAFCEISKLETTSGSLTMISYFPQNLIQ